MNMNKEKKNLLVFGYGLALILTFIGARLGIKHGFNVIHYALLFTAFILLVVTIIDYRRLKAFYEKWMKVAHFIGNVISTILLTLMFYVFFGIIGIVLRIIRKDLLDQKIELQKDSYWIKLPPKPFERKEYQRQF